MKFYLSSPANQAQAQVLIDAEVPVLVSFALMSPWLERSYLPAFVNGLLVDSGAFSALGGKTIDVGEYAEFVARMAPHADACAGLDDIRGDWRKSMANYAAVPLSFPTIHDTDPPELLDELVAMACERNKWLGVGLLPPRHGKAKWLARTLERIPDDIHVHGWALAAYARFSRLDSVDSTNWMRDGEKITTHAMTRHLTPVEALRIVVLRYKRKAPRVECRSEEAQISLIG